VIVSVLERRPSAEGEVWSTSVVGLQKLTGLRDIPDALPVDAPASALHLNTHYRHRAPMRDTFLDRLGHHDVEPGPPAELATSVVMDTFRFRLNCIDHYQATPTDLDPALRRDAGPTKRQAAPLVPVIRAFGATETGQKVCAHIHGALPYLYLEYTGSLEKDAGRHDTSPTHAPG
jgi:hypothetical protein